MFSFQSMSTPETPNLTDRGRSLRSGRTLPDSGRVSHGDSDLPGGENSEEESMMDVEEVWGGESDSTASSDISDWTAEAGINFNAAPRRPSRKRVQKRRE